MVAEVSKINVEQMHKHLTLSDGSELSCKALIYATGVSTRQLTQPGVEKLNGRGVYYGASLTEAALYEGKPMVVVGAAKSPSENHQTCLKILPY